MGEVDAVDGLCLGKLNDQGEDVYFEDQRNMETNNANNNDQVTALAPIGPKDIYYKMDHEKRGLVLIFNQENFEPQTKQTQRAGTDEDVRKIKDTFKGLGFEIHPFKDMTLDEIRREIDKYVKFDHYHKQRDCLAIFVLTHGGKDLLWAKDTYYFPDEELWGKFTSDKCPSLAGKPKLIFLQACQGGAFDQGVKLVLPQRPRTEFDGDMFYEMPVRADFLIGYATCEGYYAFRNDVKGSVWITFLCEELKKHHKNLDVQSILTIVNRRLAIEFASANKKNPALNGMRQSSYFESSLTRFLIFGEK